MYWLYVLLLFLCRSSHVQGSQGKEGHPGLLDDVFEGIFSSTLDSVGLPSITEHDTKFILITITPNCSKSSEIFFLSIADEAIASVTPDTVEFVCGKENMVIFNITGTIIGRTHLILTNPNVGTLRYPLAILRVTAPTLLESLFLYTVVLLVGIVTLGFGASLDLSLVKALLKKPVAPGIGIFCQFTAMPLISFAVTQVFHLNASLAIGLFVAGCAPGGGTSNIWTLLLGGNVDLSITMTFLSTVVSLGMIPFWLYTLGSVLVPQSDVSIPFKDLVISILLVAGPLVIGLLIARFLPKLACFLKRAKRLASIICIVLLAVLGTYTKSYILSLLASDWRILVSCSLLPYSGLIIGSLTAYLARQPCKNILTIALETAVQNSAIPIVILESTLPHPDSDIAVIMPIAISFFLPVPLLIAATTRAVYKRYKRGNRGFAGLCCPKYIYNKMNIKSSAVDCPDYSTVNNINGKTDSFNIGLNVYNNTNTTTQTNGVKLTPRNDIKANTMAPVVTVNVKETHHYVGTTPDLKFQIKEETDDDVREETKVKTGEENGEDTKEEPIVDTSSHFLSLSNIRQYDSAVPHQSYIPVTEL